MSTVSATSSPRLVLLARDIKISHSVFALPFALLATFMAAHADGGRAPSLAELTLIVICMVFARTFAMTVNRIADRKLDADNPRTIGRALPSGKLSLAFMLTTTAVCAAAFVLTCVGFIYTQGGPNPWPLLLSPLVLAWVALYSFTKRFTWLCHLFLGSALALSPVAATIAIYPPFLHRPDAWLLALMVMTWVAGFDVIYALQDVAVDRATGLFSMPSRLGENRALWLSRLLHLTSAAALILLANISSALAGFFALGVAITIALLIVEHAMVWGDKRHRIPMAFLTVNGIISLLLGALGAVDVWRG